jgi:phosphoribosylglycinamide formyltransferase-1
MSARRKVAILISGRGSNMTALLDAAAERDYPAEIIGVISDNPDAKGLSVATARGLPVHAIPRGDFASKAAHEAAINTALAGWGTEIVALAGYMRLLSASFVDTWQGRMINIHPSLLPLFKGLDTHKRALEAGMRVHGCTVHFVTLDMDGGPVIAQAAVPVLVGDTEHSLTARVLKAEHQLYPSALRLVADGKAIMRDGRTVFSGFDDGAAGSVLSPVPQAEGFDLERLARITP